MESPAGGREAWIQEPHRSQPQNQSDLGPVLVTSYMKRKLLKHFQHLRFPLDKCHGWTNWSGLLSVCPSLCCDTWSVQSTMHRVQSPLCSSAVWSTCCSLPSSPTFVCVIYAMYEHGSNYDQGTVFFLCDAWVGIQTPKEQSFTAIITVLSPRCTLTPDLSAVHDNGWNFLALGGFEIPSN